MSEAPRGLLNPKRVAEILDISPSTLERWRVAGAGPKYVKLGAGGRSRIRYRPEDVERFIAEHERASTSDSDVVVLRPGRRGR